MRARIWRFPPATSRRACCCPSGCAVEPTANDDGPLVALGGGRTATWTWLRPAPDRPGGGVAERHDIDVLTLQETKARDDEWPTMGLEVMGYDVATWPNQ